MLKKNTAGQFIYFALIKASDGSAHTGQTPTGYVSVDASAQTGIGGSIAELALGQYKIVLSQGDTNGDELGYFITNTSSIPVNISVTTETKKMADLNDIAAGALMGLADDAITSAKYDQSSAFPIESADSTSTQIARVGADGDTLESISDEIAALPTDANVTTQCALALSNIHLDHLLGVTYDPASKPGVSDALLNELIENNAGVSRYTAAALVQAPAGGGGDATEAKQDEILVDIVDMKGTAFAKDTNSLVNLHLSGADVTLSDDAITASKYDQSTAYPVTIALVPDAAAVNAQVDAAIETYHLDHLLAVDYDPASKPGVATALLNELIENNAGVSRYTTGALAQAPSGTGGDATEANQALILEDIVDMKGTAFAKDTNSLVDLALTSALSTTDGKVDSILTDTGTTLDAKLDTIITDTGTTLDGKIDTIDTLINTITDILEGDHKVDTATTPWQYLIRKNTDVNWSTPLVQQDLKTEGGVNVTSTTAVIGQKIAP